MRNGFIVCSTRYLGCFESTVLRIYWLSVSARNTSHDLHFNCQVNYLKLSICLRGLGFAVVLGVALYDMVYHV